MKDVIEKIEEIQAILEREVEWTLTDAPEMATFVKEYVGNANFALERLKIIANQLDNA